jgi:hypothetical protein
MIESMRKELMQLNGESNLFIDIFSNFDPKCTVPDTFIRCNRIYMETRRQLTCEEKDIMFKYGKVGYTRGCYGRENHLSFYTHIDLIDMATVINDYDAIINLLKSNFDNGFVNSKSDMDGFTYELRGLMILKNSLSK